MSKRNFTLLIISLVVLVITIFGWLYFSRPTVPTDGTDTEDTNFLSRFNPFASNPAPTPTPTPLPIDGEGGTATTPETVKLNKVSSVPVAGFTVFEKERFKEVEVPTEFVPALRYADRATGNIYQTFADKLDERKFSNTTIPKVNEAYFGNSGTTVVMRYLKADDKTIQTFVGNLPKELLGADTTEDNALTGSFLPDNITDVSLSSDALKIFYVWNTGENASTAIGTTMDLLSGKKIQIFDSAFTEWLTSWPNSKIITLTTKPAAQVPGHLYTLDLNTKSFTRAMGDINGLTTLTSPSGGLVLYSDNTLALSIYNKNTRSSSSLGVRTLPEKCVWGSASDTVYCAVPTLALGSEYPDLWYQGEVSFIDQIWRIDTSTGVGEIISNPQAIEGGEAIDGIKLMLDNGENYLFFVNKKDSYLWKLNLK